MDHAKEQAVRAYGATQRNIYSIVYSVEKAVTTSTVWTEHLSAGLTAQLDIAADKLERELAERFHQLCMLDPDNRSSHANNFDSFLES